MMLCGPDSNSTPPRQRYQLRKHIYLYVYLLVGKIFHLNLKFFILSSQPCKLTDFITGRLNNILMLVIFFGYITFRGKAL